LARVHLAYRERHALAEQVLADRGDFHSDYKYSVFLHQALSDDVVCKSVFSNLGAPSRLHRAGFISDYDPAKALNVNSLRSASMVFADTAASAQTA